LVETDTGEYLDLVFSFKLTPILNAGISAAGRYVYSKLDNPDQVVKIEWPCVGVKAAKAYATEEGYFEISTTLCSGPEICFELPPEALPQLLADLQELRDGQLE